MRFRLDQFLVRRGVEQLVELGGVGRLEPEHPRGVGVAVHRVGAGFDLAVGGDDFARHRGVDVGRGLHRLDHAGDLALGEALADGGQVDEDDVAERVLRVLGRDNADVDDGWLCDKGRFAYQAVHVDERVTFPMVRDGGELRPVSWDRALGEAAKALDVGIVGTFVGNDKNRPLPENLERFRELWPPLVAHAREHGVKIAIENCPMIFSLDEWPGGKNLATSPIIWRRMFNDIPSKHFGLNYDPSHFILQFMDPIGPLREFKDKLFHLQTNLRYGCVILRHYLQRERGDLFLALGRYNGSRGRAPYPNAVFAAERRWRLA